MSEIINIEDLYESEIKELTALGEEAITLKIKFFEQSKKASSCRLSEYFAETGRKQAEIVLRLQSTINFLEEQKSLFSKSF